MQFFSLTADAVAATTKKNEKVRLVADYFLARPLDEAAQAAVFFSGRVFPAWEEPTATWARPRRTFWKKPRRARARFP
jgi:hypothetical protein